MMLCIIQAAVDAGSLKTWGITKVSGFLTGCVRLVDHTLIVQSVATIHAMLKAALAGDNKSVSLSVEVKHTQPGVGGGGLVEAAGEGVLSLLVVTVKHHSDFDTDLYVLSLPRVGSVPQHVEVQFLKAQNTELLHKLSVLEQTLQSVLEWKTKLEEKRESKLSHGKCHAGVDDCSHQTFAGQQIASLMANALPPPVVKEEKLADTVFESIVVICKRYAMYGINQCGIEISRSAFTSHLPLMTRTLYNQAELILNNQIFISESEFPKQLRAEKFWTDMEPRLKQEGISFTKSPSVHGESCHVNVSWATKSIDTSS